MADLLLVEDDDDVAGLVEIFLAREGHRVRRACNGERALALLDERLPDLVVLDVEMPVLDGPSMVTRMLVEDAGRERIPVLLVSGVVDLPRVAQRVGTPYALAKPFAPTALLALASKALHERRPPTPVH